MMIRSGRWCLMFLAGIVGLSFPAVDLAAETQERRIQIQGLNFNPGGKPIFLGDGERYVPINWRQRVLSESLEVRVADDTLELFQREESPSGEEVYHRVGFVGVPPEGSSFFVLLWERSERYSGIMISDRLDRFPLGSFYMVNATGKRLGMRLSGTDAILEPGGSIALAGKADFESNVGVIIVDESAGIYEYTEAFEAPQEFSFLQVSVQGTNGEWQRPMRMRWRIRTDRRSIVVFYRSPHGILSHHRIEHRSEERR